MGRNAGAGQLSAPFGAISTPAKSSEFVPKICLSYFGKFNQQFRMQFCPWTVDLARASNRRKWKELSLAGNYGLNLNDHGHLTTMTADGAAKLESALVFRKI
jgi:hypothetical protein